MKINISGSFLLMKAKKKFKKYEELWSKIRDLIRLITKISDDYDEKYMKIKFNSDEVLPLNKTIEIPGMRIVVRGIFLENNKHYLQVLLDECLYKLSTRKKHGYNLLNKKFLYFTCVFINYNCIIDSCYLIKYRAKQKHVLPFYVTNSELKRFCINNVLLKWKVKIN